MFTSPVTACLPSMSSLDACFLLGSITMVDRYLGHDFWRETLLLSFSNVLFWQCENHKPSAI